MDNSLIEEMLKPTFYQVPTNKVEHLQTHISHLFITEARVYKVKKGVNFGFLDFSSLTKRKHYARREVELNSRLSPEIYLGVVSWGRIKGKWSWLHPDDERVEEVAVEMLPLNRGKILKRLIMEDAVPSGAMERIAKVVAGFHAKAETSSSISAFGLPENFKKNTEENFHQTKEFIGISISPWEYRLVKEQTERFYRKKGDIMKARAENGRVKDCHGDLHTEHICIANEKIYIYDCIEFNDRFRYGDMASEVAFLIMDLEFLMRKDLGQIFLGHYLRENPDPDMKEVLPFYKCYRAYVRGKVESFRLKDPFIPFEEKLSALLRAHRYFHLAREYAETML